jgi:hypothetical protein
MKAQNCCGEDAFRVEVEDESLMEEMSINVQLRWKVISHTLVSLVRICQYCESIAVPIFSICNTSHSSYKQSRVSLQQRISSNDSDEFEALISRGRSLESILKVSIRRREKERRRKERRTAALVTGTAPRDITA